ncbi:hypothetical protein, partial [Streptomyces sp. NPDC059122]|uniref:hypothetical protein n=1 Tax=unclassified Streptomyces TaxID=2593676 RepID=UPI003675D37F
MNAGCGGGWLVGGGLGHGPQQHAATAAHTSRELQPRVRAVDADVDLPPMRLAAGLDDDLAHFRDSGILGPQTNNPCPSDGAWLHAQRQGREELGDSRRERLADLGTAH